MSEREQYKDLFMAHVKLVDRYVELAQETTRAITVLGERVGQCPLKEHRVATVIDAPSDTEDGTAEDL